MKKLLIALIFLAIPVFVFSQDKVNDLVAERISFLTDEILSNQQRITALQNLNAKYQAEIDNYNSLTITVKPK